VPEKSDRSPDTTSPPSLWKKIVREKYADRERRRRETLEKTKKLLVDFFKGMDVGRVYLIGSITMKGKFYDYSDIDIAIDHLPSNMDRWMLESALEELLQHEIDLIILEKCRFRHKIREEGLRVL